MKTWKRDAPRNLMSPQAFSFHHHWTMGRLDLSSRGENIDSELSEGHVHQLDNPSAEEIKAPKDQTLVEVKPQGFDPRERKSG